MTTASEQSMVETIAQRLVRLSPEGQQRVEWHLRNCMWFVERVAPEDREMALDMFTASMEQSFYEGVSDAAWVVDRIKGAMPERVGEIVSRAIRDLAARSKPDFSAALSTQQQER